MSTTANDLRALLPLLKQYFGFGSFRPLQEEIIRDVLAGRDVFALLPTGGGKSLCYQLPALARPGLTVVVSPLISLMKDQVDALQASAIPATFLNSTLEAGESRARLRGLHAGQYRLLYVAPERLMLSGMLESLKNWNVNSIAIDEAHCISEWGHDFRPEYRQLAKLRELFPNVPLMALTATATIRVRADIVQQLHLRDPRPYVASFNRPNLHYRVVPKEKPYNQVLRYVRARPRQSGIVYCQSRKSTESLASRLQADGISAKPYHAGLEPQERAAHQDLFLRDEVRVICATIAFGMGINKPNVRYVIHHDLPKNVEGYYQETGRAGRDGLPSECLLLFSAGDVMKLLQFLKDKPPQEQKIGRQQLNQMVEYGETAECRRSFLLGYFGEKYGESNCGNCDNCQHPRETYDGTLAAQKFLSCVHRIRERTGFEFGINQVTEVLTGAETENVLKWGHHQISTYGIGREHSRAEWKAIGRQLLQLGYVQELPDKFNALQLTAEGRAVLKQRQTISLKKLTPTAEPEEQKAEKLSCDEVLLERLLALRKTLAEARHVPPHIIFSDVTLRSIARQYPTTEAQLGRITGVSQKKLQEFGEQLLGEVQAHLQVHPRQIFAEESFEKPPSRAKPAADAQGDYDASLFERLRAVRKELAQERRMPAYIILHDSKLRQMCEETPTTRSELIGIIGEKKAEDFGQLFIREIIKHLRSE